MPKLPALLAVLALLVLPALSYAAEVRVSHINGPAVQGKVFGVDGTTLKLRDLADATSPSELNLREVEEIVYFMQSDPLVAGEQYPLSVTLSSGDMFIGRVTQSDGEVGFIFESMAFGRFPIDLEQIDRIEVRNHNPEPFEENPAIRERMDEARCDALYLHPGDDAATGTLYELLDEGVDYEDEAGIIADVVPWRACQTIVRYVGNPLEQPEQFQVVVACRNGERFTGELVGFDTGSFSIRSYVLLPETEMADAPDAHADGLVLEIREEQIARMTFRHGRFAYLSDLEPREEEEYPWFGGRSAAPRDLRDYWWHYHRDESVTGAPLTLPTGGSRDATYTKGLGVHAYCRLVYRLSERYAVFMADIGLDTSAGRQGSVIFRVVCDGEVRFESEVMRRSTPLQSIEVDVRGVEEIELIVDFADNGDIQDRANWAKARLIKDR